MNNANYCSRRFAHFVCQAHLLDPRGRRRPRRDCGFQGRFKARKVLDLTVDHFSRLLFWVEWVRLPGRDGDVLEIFHSDMNGRNANLTIRLQKGPVQFQAVGNRLFWTAIGSKWVRSCDKETANLMTHGLGNLDESEPNFFIITSKPIRIEKNPCIPNALCSHICIPTPAGYMRCLCPDGYKLGPDGWTCGEEMA